MGKVKYSPEMKEQTVKYVQKGNKSVMHTVAALPSYKKATNPVIRKEASQWINENF